MWGESRQRAVEFRADFSLCQRFRANQIPVNHRKQLSIKPKTAWEIYLNRHCTQRINKQGWQALKRFKDEKPFLVLTYLGVWSQRKTPDILQVTVIRTLRSDLNINRELIWCKGRKQWFLVSCKGQPQSNSREATSLETLSPAIFTWPIYYLLIYFQTNFRKVASSIFQTAAGKTLVSTSLEQENKLRFSVYPTSCPDANSIVKQEDTRKRIKLRSYNNLKFFSYTDSMNLQIFSARSSYSTITVLCPGLTFPPSGLPLGEKSSHQQFSDHHRLESLDLLSCGDATVKIGTVCVMKCTCGGKWVEQGPSRAW